MKTTKLFTEFSVRMVALVIDVLLVMFVISSLMNFLSGFFEESFLQKYFTFFILLIYFPIFWTSPMKASPAQFILGMRVVNLETNQLDFKKAFIRAVLLLSTFYFIMTLPKIIENNLYVIIFVIGICSGFLTIITINRQALHDLLSGSIVVKRVALDSDESRHQLLSHLKDNGPVTLSISLSSIYSILFNSFIFAIPIYTLYTVNDIGMQKNIRYRIIYALSGTDPIKKVVTEHYYEFGTWPVKTSDKEFPMVVKYPDGGYSQLEDDGKISIHFTVKPMLINNIFTLTPVIKDGEIEWICHRDGVLENKYIPVKCRSQATN